MAPVDQPSEVLREDRGIPSPVHLGPSRPEGPWAEWSARRRSALRGDVAFSDPGWVLDLTGPEARVVTPYEPAPRAVTAADPAAQVIPHRLVAIAAIAIVALNVLDVITTKLALASGGTEGNPLASLFVYHLPIFITIKILLPGLVATRMWVLRDKITPMLLAAMWWVVGAYSLAIVVNTIHLFSA